MRKQPRPLCNVSKRCFRQCSVNLLAFQASVTMARALNVDCRDISQLKITKHEIEREKFGKFVNFPARF